MANLAHLSDRVVLAVTGPDRATFLQGLVSNDVAALVPGETRWAALLTPQGKYLADFLLIADTDRILLDLPESDAELVRSRLARFRLRSDVAIGPASLAVHAEWGANAPARNAAGDLLVRDTRLPEAGWRRYASAPLAGADPDGAVAYDLHRLQLGFSDGTRDLERERTVLLEAGFDELSGVSWTKGCWMGQELTARTRYRGLLKRRLVPVAADAGRALPPAGTALADAAGREVGTMRSSRDGFGLATLRIDAIGSPVHAGDTVLRARVPAWMRIPEPERAAELAG